MSNEKVYGMRFGKIYSLLVAKAQKKGRTLEEVNQVVSWLTGYTAGKLKKPQKAPDIRRLFPQCAPPEPEPEVDYRRRMRGACGNG